MMRRCINRSSSRILIFIARLVSNDGKCPTQQYFNKKINKLDCAHKIKERTHQSVAIRIPCFDDRVRAGVVTVTVAPGVRELPFSCIGVIQPI